MDTLVYAAKIKGCPKNICIVYAQFSRQQRGTEKEKYFQRLTVEMEPPGLVWKIYSFQFLKFEI